MSIAIAVITAAIVLGYLFLPLVFVVDNLRPNANNNRFRVVIRRTMPQGQSWLGVLAQEYFESRYKWTHWFMDTKAREEMELLGHAIEAMVAFHYDGMDLDAYEVREAFALSDRNSSYAKKGMFVGAQINPLVAELRRRRPDARLWMEMNEGFLEKWEKN
jgi:hypothetical protein